MRGVSVSAVVTAREEDVLPSLSQTNHFYFQHDSCLSLSSIWEFLRAEERKQHSGRPPVGNRRKRWRSGGAEGGGKCGGDRDIRGSEWSSRLVGRLQKVVLQPCILVPTLPQAGCLWPRCLTSLDLISFLGEIGRWVVAA